MKYNNSQKRVNRMSGLRCRKEILCIIAAIKASETNIEHLKFLIFALVEQVEILFYDIIKYTVLRKGIATNTQYYCGYEMVKVSTTCFQGCASRSASATESCTM